MRISTAGLYQTMSAAAMRSQVAYSNASEQESSGLLSTDFSGYGATTQRILNLEAEVQDTQTWANNAGVAGDRAQSMYTAVGAMISTLTSLKTTISEAMSSQDNSGLSNTATNYLDEIAADINTQSGGRYLFSGGATDTKPVDLTSYPATSPPSATTTDTSYYQGDDSLAAVAVGASERITYGVTGNNSGFEKALRACAMVANVTTSPLDTAALSSAYSLAATALTELSNMQASISTVASRLSDTKTSLTSTVTTVQNTLADVKNVDATEASLKVSTYKTQLQASYSALAGVMKVKLTDYL